MSQLSEIFSPLAVLNATAGDTRVIEVPGIAFGDGPRDRVDLYRPRERREAGPVCVFFYGGGWEDGDRGEYRFVGTALAGQGIITAIPDYRVYPETRFPGFLEDAARAVRWAFDTFGAGGRLILAGHSAGAHIAAMLAFDPQWLAGVGMDARTDVAGLVGLAGPYDFLPLRSPVLKTIFGPEGQRAATQPINHVRPDAPPTWLGTGRRDRIVEPGNSERLAARLSEAGVTVESHVYPLASHETLIGSFARPLRFIAPALRDVSAFVGRVGGQADGGRTEAAA